MSDCKHQSLSAQSCPDCGESMYESVKDLHIQIAELEQRLAQFEGKVVVPLKPTSAMLRKGIRKTLDAGAQHTPTVCTNIYKAMIKAAQEEK